MYTVHGRSTLKDDCDWFWNRPVYELKEKCKTCNEMSKLHEPSVSINDEQAVTTIDVIITEHCTVSCCMETNTSVAVWKSSIESFMC